MEGDSDRRLEENEHGYRPCSFFYADRGLAERLDVRDYGGQSKLRRVLTGQPYGLHALGNRSAAGMMKECGKTWMRSWKPAGGGGIAARGAGGSPPRGARLAWPTVAR